MLARRCGATLLPQLNAAPITQAAVTLTVQPTYYLTTTASTCYAPVPRPSLDFRSFRNDYGYHANNMKNRAMDVSVLDTAVSSHRRFGELTEFVNGLRHERNAITAKLGKGAFDTPDEKGEAISRAREIKEEIALLEVELREIESVMLEAGSGVPNTTHSDTPVGAEPDATVVIKHVNASGRRGGGGGVDNGSDSDTNETHSTSASSACESGSEGKRGKTSESERTVLAHEDIVAAHDMVDFSRGAEVSGSKFFYLKNDGVWLELALVQWALARAAAAGYTPVATPDLVRGNVAAACGFQPRGPSSQTYHVSAHDKEVDGKDDDLVLIGTSEIPLAAMQMNNILSPSQLPHKVVGLSHCFRAEAGSGGAADHGLYRVHQFTKVELFAFSLPEESERVHTEMVELVESMYSELGLDFRLLNMPTEALGAPAHCKVDLEAWMPGKGVFGELASISNCTDYQARRLGIRYRDEVSGRTADAVDNKPKFVHTLNGTACAVPRTLIAILETHQGEDGSVRVPECLAPFMPGRAAAYPHSPLEFV